LKFRHDASLEHDVNEYALSAHWFAVQYCSVLKSRPSFWINRASLSPSIPNPATHTQKRTARFSPAVQVREETPGKGSDRGLSLMFILQIKVPRALTGLNSCTHFGSRLTSASSFAAARCHWRWSS
jgi:hypothetical protein